MRDAPLPTRTRAKVLRAEAFILPEQVSRCCLIGGLLLVLHDRYVDGPTGLDVDHLVPLGEAGDSGVSAWSAGEREAYVRPW